MVHDDPQSWATTTHQWADTVDLDHLRGIRDDPATYAPSVWHLVLEVLAYARDEATSRGTGHAVLTLHTDGTIEVTDDGRGTDTRTDTAGRPTRKPVMATRDVRFFDHPDAETLLDGHPRRGLSVVAASSDVLVHTNHRRDGAWTQRYQFGVPIGALTPLPTTGTTGTSVTFRPRGDLPPLPRDDAEFTHHLDHLAPLTVQLRDHRDDDGGRRADRRWKSR